jgi:hypothetical protein
VQILIRPPFFTSLEDIARNVDGVSLIQVENSAEDLRVPPAVLRLERDSDVVKWQVGQQALVFPASLVRSISVERCDHLGNQFLGLTLAFDGAERGYAYRMLVGDETCDLWLRQVAADVSRVTGAPFVERAIVG